MVDGAASGATASCIGGDAEVASCTCFLPVRLAPWLVGVCLGLSGSWFASSGILFPSPLFSRQRKPKLSMMRKLHNGLLLFPWFQRLILPLLMPPMNRWIIRLWWWRLSSRSEVTQQFVVRFEERKEHGNHLTSNAPD